MARHNPAVPARRSPHGPRPCRHTGERLSLLLLWPPIAAFLPPPSSLPPPEWIDPYLDVSDLTHRHPSNPPLLPSPWLIRVVSLVLDPPSPSLEPSLDAFCHCFLLRLPSAFVFVALCHPDLHRCPVSALRFFCWATRQKNYPGHNLDSYASLIDALSSFSPYRIQPNPRAGDRDRDWAELRLTPPAAASLIHTLRLLGMVDELLWV